MAKKDEIVRTEEAEDAELDRLEDERDAREEQGQRNQMLNQEVSQRASARVAQQLGMQTMQIAELESRLEVALVRVAELEGSLVKLKQEKKPDK